MAAVILSASPAGGVNLAAPPAEGDARTGVGAHGGPICAQEGSRLKAKAWQQRGKRGKMVAAILAASSAGNNPVRGWAPMGGPSTSGVGSRPRQGESIERPQIGRKCGSG